MTVEERLARLERENRWLRRGGGVALAAIATVLLVGQAGSKPLADLEARSLTIKDASGRETLTIEPPLGLQLRDNTGKVRARLGLDGVGAPHLSLYDDQGKGSVGLHMTKDSAAMALFDGSGAIRAHLQVDRDAGTPSLIFRDPAGEVTWQAPK